MPKKLNENDNGSINLVQAILNYIEEHIYEELTPKIIADHAYISISAMNSLFRIVCNMTVMEYVRNRRLSLAGQELIQNNTRVIDLAYKYGYETPEAFAKAFTRFCGYPPSFIRRTYPAIKVFNPLQITFELSGGWDSIKVKGGSSMDKQRYEYRICLKDTKQKMDWDILLTLAKKLDESQIKFKVDGKTMIFAHGLEFKLDKICLTFKWGEEQKVLDFFGNTGKAKLYHDGFKYFDTSFKGMKVRCMFYGNCQDEDTDEFLYRNADPVNIDGYIINVQTLEFFIENTEPDNEYYNLVDDWLKKRG